MGKSSFFTQLTEKWKSLWLSRTFKVHFFLSVISFILVIYYSSLYLSIMETRRGTVLLDPFLSRLTPREFSLPIFAIIHSALLISLMLILAKPKTFLKALQACSLLLVLRTITVYLFPLESPHGMIYLHDPITGFFLNNVNVVTKDLFFSGHVSVMCLLIYFSTNKLWKTYLTVVTPMLALMIMWQHVHYTVDIIAAPFFAVFCCKLIEKLHQKWEHGIDRIDYQQLHMKRITNRH